MEGETFLKVLFIVHWWQIINTTCWMCVCTYKRVVRVHSFLHHQRVVRAYIQIHSNTFNSMTNFDTKTWTDKVNKERLELSSTDRNSESKNICLEKCFCWRMKIFLLFSLFVCCCFCQNCGYNCTYPIGFIFFLCFICCLGSLLSLYTPPGGNCDNSTHMCVCNEGFIAFFFFFLVLLVPRALVVVLPFNKTQDTFFLIVSIV